MKISLLLATLALAPLSNARTAPALEAAQEAKASVEWFEGSFDELLAKAKEEDRGIFLHFWAKWSQKSIALTRVYRDPAVVEAIGNRLCFAIDTVLKPGRPTELARRFNAEKPPRILFLDSEGNVIDHLLDLTDEANPTPEELVAEIRRIESGEGTIPALMQAVEAAPSDVNLRFSLAKKQRHVGNKEAFELQISEIRKLDPEGNSLPLRSLKVEGWQEILWDYTRGQQDARKGIAAAELTEFLKDEEDSGLLYDGWSTVSSYWSNQALYAKRSYKHEDARKHSAQFVAALRKAQEHITEKARRLTGAYTPALIYQLRDYVDDEAKAYALSLAEQCIGTMPDSSDAMDSYACALYMTGDKAKAIDMIQRARQLDPSNWILQERLKEFE